MELTGFQHSGNINFILPKYNLIVELIDKRGFGRKEPAVIDTLQVDLKNMNVYIVWRAFAPYREGFSGINIELLS